MSSTRIHEPIRAYTHGLSESKPRSQSVPYGAYKYDSSKNYLPPGLFHFVKDSNRYVPTLHGLSLESVGRLKEVAVCCASSSIVDRPFLNAPHLYEVELINTGHETLKQGDRFSVQLPDRKDVAAQLGVEGDPGYDLNVNKGIWGGLLATRRVNCDCGGDPVEEVVQALKHDGDFDVFQLVSPYHPQSVLAIMTLLANGADYHRVDIVTRNAAASLVNDRFDSNLAARLVQDQEAKRFLKTVIGHAMTVVESVQGFAGGQVLRARKGHIASSIRTGDRFVAQLDMHRWLL
uniref:Capsid triplex protein n=1 Tax=Oryzias latipes TaxID=8090 RepID=A0A286P9V4_ORYLA|nr:capsid triplex protein [Oryzias latipes]